MSPEEALEKISAQRQRVAASLTLVMVVAYFGFVLLIAFDKPLMGSLIAGGDLSIGILIGALVILLAPLLTGIYVRWANVNYDQVVERLRLHRRIER
ncbi:MAG: DUF485 domain-containing protein [Polyangiales bacterium]